MNLLKRYKKIKIPAQYGTIERKTLLDDGSYHIEEERVLLRPESEEYENIKHKFKYRTVSERILVPERKFKRQDGTYQTFPQSYKTVTKTLVAGVETMPPSTAIKTIKFLVKRDVRNIVLKELNADYSEEQVKEFGPFGADVWYWKEVILLILTRTVKSDFGNALGKFFSKDSQ